MRQLLYILILIFTCISCEDVIDVEVPNGSPKLVIDASFEFFLNENPIGTRNSIQLSLSAPFFGSEIPTVSDATVFITNLQDNTIYNFLETNNPGSYTPDTIFLPQFDTDYQLTVIYNSETYIASTRLIPTVPIDNITQGDGTLFDGDETEVIISFTDNGSRNDFYLFDFDFSLFLASEDRFYQGEAFNFSYFYEDMVTGQDVRIKILGVDERYYNYINLLLEQSEQDGGNPFQTPPAVLRGNITNTTNATNFALGYFNLSEANKFDFVIQE